VLLSCSYSLDPLFVITQFWIFYTYCVILVLALKWFYFQFLTPISQRNMRHGVLWGSWPYHVRAIYLMHALMCEVFILHLCAYQHDESLSGSCPPAL
jgi:hypothetical protein